MDEAKSQPLSIDRQALLLRARKRIEEKRLFQQVLLEPKDVTGSFDGVTDSAEEGRDSVPRTIPTLPSALDMNSIPLPAARYRRMSLNPTAGSIPFISRARSISHAFNELPAMEAAVAAAANNATSTNNLASPSAISPPRGLAGRRNTPSPILATSRQETTTSSSDAADTKSISDENLPIPLAPPKITLKIDVGNDNLATPSSRTEFFEPLSAKRAISASRDTLGNPISRKLEKMLEKGVTMSPVDVGDVEYTGLSVTPATARIESEQEVKRKGIMLKRGKRAVMPDDTPIKDEGKCLYKLGNTDIFQTDYVYKITDIQEITELQELYSSNSSLTVRLKWSSSGKSENLGDAANGRTFLHPAPFSQTVHVSHAQLSPLDGFYIPETPMIAPWNYDRLLRRLHKTEPEG